MLNYLLPVSLGFDVLLLILVIYLLVFLLSWLVNSSEAQKANQELQEYQRLHGADAP